MRTPAGIVLCALLVAACGPVESETSSSTTSTIVATTTGTAPSTQTPTTVSSTTLDPSIPRPGGMVTIAADVPRALNPKTGSAAGLLTPLVVPGAYVIGPDGTRVPYLVTGIPTVANGGVVVDGVAMEVTWTIDTKAVWSDGNRVVTEDFTLAATTPCPGIDTLAVVEVLDADPGQIRLRFPAITPEYLDTLQRVVPSHVVTAATLCADDGWSWPSTGPFVVAEAVGSAVELVRNERYWKRDPATDARLPYLDSIRVVQIEPDSAPFSTPGVDVADGFEYTRGFGFVLPKDVVLDVAPGMVWEHINFQFGSANRNPDSLNEHLAYRQALAYAIDREALAEAVGWVATTGLDPAVSGGPWTPYSYDPAEARDLIADLCVELDRNCQTNPPRLIFSTTSNAEARPRIAEMLEEMWEAVGVDVELQLEDSALFFGETGPNGTFDVALWAWLAPPGPAGWRGLVDVFDSESPGPGGDNWYHWGSAGSSLVDDPGVIRAGELIAELRTEIDPAVVASLLAELEQLLADQVVVIPVATRPETVVYRNVIVGPTAGAAPDGFTWNTELWYRTDV